MRKTKTSLSGLLALALLATVLVGCTTAQAAAEAEVAAAQRPDRYITVVGSGEVSLVPDIAEVNIGAEVAAATVSEAKAEVDRRVEAIMVAFQEMGIAEQDIQTSHYSIHFERESFGPVAREEGAPETEGAYRVFNMLNVTIREIEQVGEILDAAIEAGANQMYGVNFTISDTQEWESEAREKAMADAKARAEELAQLGGVELGEVLSVSEVVGGTPFAATVERAMGGGGGIAPGELDFSARIQVTFAIQ